MAGGSLLLLVLAMTALPLADAARKRKVNNHELDKNDHVEEHQNGAEQRKVCTIVEAASSRVKYGIRLKFPVRGCIHCNPNKVISETIPSKFIIARPNRDETACACYAQVASDRQEFLFGFTAKELINDDGCKASTCWSRYQNLAEFAKLSEMAKSGYKTTTTDFIASANHYSSRREEGDDFSADCSTQDSVHIFDIPNVDSMLATLKKIGDARAVKTLADMAAIKENLDDASEVAKLAESSDSKLILTKTTAEDTELESPNEPDLDTSNLSEQQLLEVLEDDGGLAIAQTRLVDIVPAPKTKTRTFVQGVMLGPKQGLCSRAAENYAFYKDSACGPIETEAQCRSEAEQYTQDDRFTAFTHATKKRLTDRVVKNLPSGCFMRRMGKMWHGFWNEIHSTERSARGKSRRSAWEYRLLCGCYREV